MFKRRGTLLLFPILMLMLSGCFRQASDPIEPVNESLSDQSSPAIVTSTPSIPDEMETEEAETTPDSGPGEIEIAVTASTPVPLATSTTPANPTPRPLATSADGTPSSITGPVQMESPAPTFVTPISPNQGAISTPTPQPTNSIDPTPTDLMSEETEIEGSCVYVVQRGDTLYRIALAFDTTVDAITAVNPGISPALIIPGDEIIIPDCEEDETAATEESVTDDTTTVGAPEPLTHTVSAGETLGAIARRYDVTIASIIEANSLSDPDRLSIGQVLIIPTGS